MDRLSYTIVASLDLGTTNSGYAFASTSELTSDKLKIHVNQAWIGGSQLCSFKTPTCILLDGNKELAAFGYEAENTFAELCMAAEQDEYYFFRGFYTKKNFTSDTMLIDETGKTLPAYHVFKVLIKAFANSLTKLLDRSGAGIKKSEIRWVIPVPTYLSDTGKEFLRSCAEKAGITSDQLMLVTKSEAAFIYCQQLPDLDHYQKLQDGTEYMVVLLGGCSADIIVLKKDSNQVIEKYRTTGNDCGGTSVYNSFLNFLCKIFGLQVLTSLKKEHPYSLLDLEREFEMRKRHVEGHLTKFSMSVPYGDLDSLCRKYIAKNISDVIASSIYSNNLTLRGDKMRIDFDKFQNFLKPTIDKIINLMENVFADYKDAHNVNEIVMVAGFSECSLVQDKVRQTFSKKTIITPEDAGLAVMKGAVLCGHQPCQYIQLTPTKMKSAQTSVTKCIFCDNPGIYHCTECTSAFCQQCRTKHDKLPTTKNHTVTDLKNMNPSAFLTEAKCVSHKSEFIYFCTKCHVLICGRCVTTEHKGHDITDIKTVADMYRRSAEGNISDLKIAVTKLSKVVGQMKEIEKPTIKRTSESAVAEIGEAVKEIMKAVSFTKENKLDEVKSQFDMEMEEFQYDLKNKERIYEHQKNICESLERLMSVSHDITFITSYETLKRDIHDISDLLGERGQEKVYKFDQKVFVQEVVNVIVADFEMRLVGKEDGSVVLMHRAEIQKKEKEKKQK